MGGWFQAGNLGEATGWAAAQGLWVATNVPSVEHPQQWISGAVLGVTFLVGSLALFAVPEVKADGRSGSLPRAMVGVAVDMWRMIKSHSRDAVLLVVSAPHEQRDGDIGTLTGRGRREVET